jgi:hypothetical protein
LTHDATMNAYVEALLNSGYFGQFFTDQVEWTTVEMGEKIRGRDAGRDFIGALHMDPAHRLHRVGRTPVGRTYRRHDETLLELLPRDLKRQVSEPIAVCSPETLLGRRPTPRR